MAATPFCSARPARVLASAALLLLVAGCSGAPTVDQGDLEEQISTKLEEQIGQKPDDISCPDDLAGEDGETMECTLTAGEDKLGVTVTVTEVDGNDVSFDIVVDDEVQ